jgi:hypothetical protein
MGEYYRTNKVHGARDSKKMDAPKAKLTVENVGSYLSAEASLQLRGPVSDEVFELRKAQCVACPSRALSDNLPDEIGYCKSCGCGVSERARLTVKLTMPKTKCPLGKWGEAEGRRPSTIEQAKEWIAKKILGA